MFLQKGDDFSLNPAILEDGKGKCPYDPAKGHTGLIVGMYKYLWTVLCKSLESPLILLPAAESQRALLFLLLSVCAYVRSVSQVFKTHLTELKKYSTVSTTDYFLKSIPLTIADTVTQP